MAADWLSDAIVYEIHPQSYADSDSDGIGGLERVRLLLGQGVDVAPTGVRVDGFGYGVLELA